jgi:hypothetical protein
MLTSETHRLDGIQRNISCSFTSASSITHGSLLQSAQAVTTEGRTQQRQATLQQVAEQRSRPKPYDPPQKQEPGEVTDNHSSTSKTRHRCRKHIRTQTSDPSKAFSMTHQQ